MLKKLALVIAFSGLMAGMAHAGMAARTGVVGSMHDMNSAGSGAFSNDPYNRVCAYCHTPHNAQAPGIVPAPLWNHGPQTGAVDPYAWASPANASIVIADPLAGPSRLCMSCHDGVSAVDSHGSIVGGATMSGSKKIGDLTLMHPIGFSYDDARTARGDNALAAVTDRFIDEVTSSTLFDTFDHTNGNLGATWVTKTIGSGLYGNMVTCASCHDVHNSTNAVPNVAGSYNYFLHAKEEGSAICLSCHKK